LCRPQLVPERPKGKRTGAEKRTVSLDLLVGKEIGLMTSGFSFAYFEIGSFPVQSQQRTNLGIAASFRYSVSRYA
jgi:hypothetical protein